MEARTPTCEEERLLDQEVVRMTGILINSVGLPSHAPIKTRAATPRDITSPSHLRGAIEAAKKRFSSSLTYTCNDVSIVINLHCSLIENRPQGWVVRETMLEYGQDKYFRWVHIRSSLRQCNLQ